ncbi:MAG TPA: pyridoxamine kinase [Clostridia bacterium]|jgi:pyridoxine kinase
MKRQKRVVAIHDISCFGRCSLTVALPIISAAGIETSIIPTAILSTHTGGFTGFTYRDLTEDILPIVKHWKTLGLEFDAIYTGFLGSFEQIDIVCEVIDLLKTQNTKVIVDPVMADHGQLYKIFPSNFPEGMKKLCKKADIIIPNITEAVFLLNEPYKAGPYEKEYIENILKNLSQFCSQAVLTGVYFDDQNLGAAAYDKQTDKISYSFSKKIGQFYHGTGDVFGSALTAAIVNEKPLEKAIDIAVKFTAQSIQRTFEAQTDIRFGVNFEEGLQDLLKL